MLPKILDTFISTESSCVIDRKNTCFSPLQIPMKPIFVSTKNIASSKLPVKVNEKRKADTSCSEGPVKKRHFTKDHTVSAYVSRQLCTRKEIEEHIRTLFLIQFLNKTLPFFLGTHQASLVNNAHAPIIHDPQYQKLNLKPMNKLFYFENQTSSKNHTLTNNKKAHRQRSFDCEATQGRHESDLKNCLHALENEHHTVNKQLSLIQDKDNLSELQCLIRENIELFTATEQDKSTYFR